MHLLLKCVANTVSWCFNTLNIAIFSVLDEAGTRLKLAINVLD